MLDTQETDGGYDRGEKETTPPRTEETTVQEIEINVGSLPSNPNLLLKNLERIYLPDGKQSIGYGTQVKGR